MYSKGTAFLPYMFPVGDVLVVSSVGSTWCRGLALSHSANIHVRREMRYRPLYTSSLSSSHAGEVIQSLQNPRVKAARALLRRRQREKERKMLVEGTRLVLDAVDFGLQPEALFYTKEALARGTQGQRLSRVIESCWHDKSRRAFAVSDQVMNCISDTVSPQGCIAIMPQPSLSFPEHVSLVLVCDSVHDPGNIGTLLRSAAGANVDGVILTSGCADVWSLKALRAGMGAQLRLPVKADVEWPVVADLLQSKFECAVCVADGDMSDSAPEAGNALRTLNYSDYDWTKKSALVIGSEADGPSVSAMKLASCKVSIPLARNVESLNAATAGAVILFEAIRQRNLGTGACIPSQSGKFTISNSG